MVLNEVFPKDTIVVNLSSTEKDELFEELVETIHNACPKFNKEEALNCLNERESKMTTGIMHSVAIPHALISSMQGSVGAIGISQEGIDYDSLDKAPVHVVFMIIGNEKDTEHHIQLLRQLASEGRTIICVLHDLNAILWNCSRCILLDKGNVFAYGETKSVLTVGNIKTVYGIDAEIIEHKGKLTIIY